MLFLRYVLRAGVDLVQTNEVKTFTQEVARSNVPLSQLAVCIKKKLVHDWLSALFC